MVNTYDIAKGINIEHYLIRRFIERYISNKKNAHRKNIHYHFRRVVRTNERGKEIITYDITRKGLEEVINKLVGLKRKNDYDPSGELSI